MKIPKNLKHSSYFHFSFFHFLKTILKKWEKNEKTWRKKTEKKREKKRKKMRKNGKNPSFFEIFMFSQKLLQKLFNFDL